MTLIAVLVAAAFAGDCRIQSSRIVAAQVTTKAAAFVQVPVYDPYFAYVVGAGDRLRRLEEIAERQQRLAEQQAALIEAVRAGATSAGQDGESQVARAAREVIGRRCASCHSGGDPKGGLDLVGPLDVPTRLLVSETAASGAMPPQPHPPLSDDEAQRLADWATEDREAVRSFLRAQVRARNGPQNGGD